MIEPAPDAQADPAYAAAHRAQRRARKRRTRPAGTQTHGASNTPARRSPAQQAGDGAEEQALQLLLGEGLTLVTRNFACRAGEIDLIMQDCDILVFVEVRSRANARYGGAAGSVSIAKQRRLLQTARFFLTYRWQGRSPRCRFDVVASENDGTVWLRDAFRE